MARQWLVVSHMRAATGTAARASRPANALPSWCVARQRQSELSRANCQSQCCECDSHQARARRDHPAVCQRLPLTALAFRVAPVAAEATSWQACSARRQRADPRPERLRGWPTRATRPPFSAPAGSHGPTPRRELDHRLRGNRRTRATSAGARASKAAVAARRADRSPVAARNAGIVAVGASTACRPRNGCARRGTAPRAPSNTLALADRAGYPRAPPLGVCPNDGRVGRTCKGPRQGTRANPSPRAATRVRSTIATPSAWTPRLARGLLNNSSELERRVRSARRRFSFAPDK